MPLTKMTPFRNAGGEDLFILHYWRGNGRLWKVFWIYGLLISTVLSIVCFLALLTESSSIQQAALFLAFAYTFWISVSVTRCADNVDSSFLSLIARGLTSLWAFCILLVLGSLQIRLLGSYILGLSEWYAQIE
jgi:hypothetical protein